MTLTMYVEFVIMILVTVAVAYLSARIDIGWIQRRARRQGEQQHIVEVLKRSE